MTVLIPTPNWAARLMPRQSAPQNGANRTLAKIHRIKTSPSMPASFSSQHVESDQPRSRAILIRLGLNSSRSSPVHPPVAQTSGAARRGRRDDHPAEPTRSSRALYPVGKLPGNALEFHQRCRKSSAAPADAGFRQLSNAPASSSRRSNCSGSTPTAALPRCSPAPLRPSARPPRARSRIKAFLPRRR